MTSDTTPTPTTKTPDVSEHDLICEAIINSLTDEYCEERRLVTEAQSKLSEDITQLRVKLALISLVKLNLVDKETFDNYQGVTSRVISSDICYKLPKY